MNKPMDEKSSSVAEAMRYLTSVVDDLIPRSGAINIKELVQALRDEAEISERIALTQAADAIEELVEALTDYVCPGLDNKYESLRCASTPKGECLRELCGDYCGKVAKSVLTSMGVTL